MDLEAAIHERWSMFHSLTALVPAERVFTGHAQGAVARPYVTIERKPALKSTRTSSGHLLTAIGVRFNVWGTDLDQAKAVAGEICARFSRADFAWSGGSVLDGKRTGLSQSQQLDGTWSVAVDYELQTIERAA